jgi:hypothetical protein
MEIGMENRFKQLDSEYEHKDTVLSFLPSSLFKVSEFILAALKAYQDYGLDALKNTLTPRGGIQGDYSTWFNKGVPCEILSPGNNGWKKGKVRIKITLEFCPDEPEILETPVSNNPVINKSESPLDDIRQMMNGIVRSTNSIIGDENE